MPRPDGMPTEEEEAEAMALHFAAAQQAAASNAAAAASAGYGMIPPPGHHHHHHGMGMPHMMGGMGMHHQHNFFPNMAAMNHPSSVAAAAMMAESQRQQQAAAFSHSMAMGGSLPYHIPLQNSHHTNNSAAAAAAVAVAANSKSQQQASLEAQPRIVHDAATAPRPVEVPQPKKRGPGRPVGSGRRTLQNKALLLAATSADGGGLFGEDPNTGLPYFNSESPEGLESQDSDSVSIPNINSQGSSGSKINAPTVHTQVIFGTGRPEMPPPKWYASYMPLGLPDDKFYLSELQCLLRDEFVEIFGTTEEDLENRVQGRNKPIALGQVGLRCKHCKDLPPNERAAGHSPLYPTFMSGIYNAVQQMYRMHISRCDRIPQELKSKLTTLETYQQSNRGGRKQYWIDSAKRMGMVDTQFGIHYGRDPSAPLPAYVAVSASLEDDDMNEDKTVQAEPEYYPLVLPEDRGLISDYLYLAMEQMQPCNLMDADRVGCYKGRKTGFPGMACKHCVGQAGCGRYFPATEASLSQTTTSQTIANHVRNCRRCPIDIREQLEFMKMSKSVSKKSGKPRHGGRKVFFHRLWCRIQRIPITDEEELMEKESSAPRKRKTSDASLPEGKKIKRDVTKSKDFDDTKDVSARSEVNRPKKKVGGKKYMYEGKALLAKGDDNHWLSDAEVYIRQELVEVFTATKSDKFDFGEPEVGQVGIRCTFCARNRPKEQRVKGHVCYPTSVSAIQQSVKDLQSRHLQICGVIPDHCRERLRSLKGYGSRPVGDSAQYWIDSARELGLDDSTDGLGVTFVTNPLAKTPADCLDIERSEGLPTGSFLIRAEDRRQVTDSMTLLLKQFRPCRFQASDRRGSRSRDRALGTPGIYCVHCVKKRYFPVTEKKLIDTLILMKTHMKSCASMPSSVKASLSYLSHRSLLQKGELGGQWKSKLFKKIWNRLHHEDFSDFDYSIPGLAEALSAREDSSHQEDSAFASHGDSMEETDYTSAFTENQSSGYGDEDYEEDSSEALEGMKDLIKAAAIWLCERDAEQEKKQARSKGLGQARSRPGYRGGRGGGGGR